MARFKRILLKLSGESLMGEKQYGIDEKRLNEYAQQIKEIHELGVQIGIVIGGGNIFRGLSGASKGFDRVKGDQMGMLATVINSLCLKDALARAGAEAEVMTAVAMPPFADLYSAEKAIDALESGKIVVFGAGLGIPFLSTDTAGAVRAAEIKADAMLMAKNIDYIYTDDPRKNPDAKKLENVKASEVLAMNLKAIDATATAFCLSVGMPIRVFGFKHPDDIVAAVTGKTVGTVVSAE